MSKKSDSPAAYEDVKYVMNIALNKPGLIYECNTPGAAIHFKQRCNRYRNLMRDMAAELETIPGHRPQTAYDHLVIRQTDKEGLPDRQGVRLIFDHQTPVGRIIDPQSLEEIPVGDGLDFIKGSGDD